MAHDPPESAVRSAGSARWPWHVVYYVLAAVNVVTIATTLILTHRIVGNFRDATQINQRWLDLLDESARLAQLAGDVDAPGNDVFESQDASDESRRLARAHERFTRSLSAARRLAQDRRADPGQSELVTRLLRDLEVIEASEQEMADEGRRILALFHEGRGMHAGTKMATMDRRYANLLASIASFDTDVRRIQSTIFVDQGVQARRLQRSEWLLAVVALSIMLAAIWYGRQIAHEMRRAELASAAHEAEVARHTGELAAARDAALSANRAKSAFLQTMSHELRTPLNGVLGMTELLLDSPLTEEQREQAHTVQSCGTSLLALLDDVLEYSQAEGGRHAGESVEFDPQALAEEIIDAFAPEAYAKGLTLGAIVSPRLPVVVGGDLRRLRLVLRHLVQNAVQFTTRGDIQLKIEASEDLGSMIAVRFEVMDSGKGIPISLQPQLFQPFTQADSSSTRAHGGAGMGLAVAQRLVRLMGGRIDFESEAGVGTHFWFTIPLEVHATARSNDPDAASKRVLCVVSNARKRERLRDQILAWGYDTDAVDDLHAAKAALEAGLRDERPFHIVVLSLAEGTVNAARALREIQAPRSLAILYINPPIATVESGSAASACDLVLTAPVHPSLLRESLAALGTPVSAAERALRAAKPRARILIVDDSPLTQRLLQLQVQRLGHVVQVVPHARAALLELQSSTFELVMIDAHLGDTPCATLAGALRAAQHGRPSPAPLIAMTGFLEPRELQQLREAGLDDHITKPVTLESLQALIARHVAPQATPERAA